MSFSMLLPLLVMRVGGALKDLWYSVGDRDADTSRRVLDVVDFVMLVLAGVLAFHRLPPLEAAARSAANAVVVAAAPATPPAPYPPWLSANLQESFDDLEFTHLLTLAQAGLLLLVSLLKLAARSFRASARNIERAVEETELEEENLRQLSEVQDALAALKTQAQNARMLQKRELSVVFEDGVPVRGSSPKSSVLGAASSPTQSVPPTPTAHKLDAAALSASSPAPAAVDSAATPPPASASAPAPALAAPPPSTLATQGWQRIELGAAPPKDLDGRRLRRPFETEASLAAQAAAGAAVAVATFTLTYRNAERLMELFRLG